MAAKLEKIRLSRNTRNIGITHKTSHKGLSNIKRHSFIGLSSKSQTVMPKAMATTDKPNLPAFQDQEKSTSMDAYQEPPTFSSEEPPMNVEDNIF